MDRTRPKTRQNAEPAASALTSLVRLLAGQAAREWLEGGPESGLAPPPGLPKRLK
jgi:hypothetical protein